MKHILVAVMVLVVLGGFSCDFENSSTNDSLLQKKIVCEEKGREYIEGSDYGVFSFTEFAYSKKLDTCLVYFNISSEDPRSRITVKKVEDILVGKVILFSRSGDGTRCQEWEENCFGPEEFDVEKEKLFE
jgi:hypothetical protein